MKARPGSLLALLLADPKAGVPAQARGVRDADAVVRFVRAAVALPHDADARILAAWDAAGALHDPEALDRALLRLTAGGWVPLVGALNRRKLSDSARTALSLTSQPGTVELAVAVLGATGTAADAETLEALARNAAFNLHAVTALSNLEPWQGRAALLRLLVTTDGDLRVNVIDRLLPHVREPAVRLALVRDALTGLDDAHAAEVAPDIAAMCDVKACLTDENATPDVRAGARNVIDHAQRAAGRAGEEGA